MQERVLLGGSWRTPVIKKLTTPKFRNDTNKSSWIPKRHQTRSSMYGSNIIARIYRDIQGTKINVPNHTKATNALLKQHQRRYNYSYQMMEKNWMMYPLFPVRIYKQCHKKSCISTEDVEALNNFVKKRTEWILNRAWCLLFETARYHSWNPPPPYPLLKDGGGGGRTFQKLSHLRGYQKFC